MPRAAKPKQSDRITLAQGAKIAGVFPSNFAKMMERHGYAKGPDGKWSHDEAVLASIAGKELNKNQVEDKILAGPGGMTLSQARLHMQLQKILLTLYHYRDIVWVEDRERPNPKPNRKIR